METNPKYNDRTLSAFSTAVILFFRLSQNGLNVYHQLRQNHIRKLGQTTNKYCILSSSDLFATWQ